MVPHSNIPHDAYESETLDGRSYALARLLSQIFHPILLNIGAFLIVGYAALSTPAEGLKWAGICILVLVLPPTIFYYIRLRQGVYVDEDVSVREQRNELYLFGFIWALIATALLSYIGRNKNDCIKSTESFFCLRHGLDHLHLVGTRTNFLEIAQIFQSS